jgi:hypothetical protein
LVSFVCLAAAERPLPPGVTQRPPSRTFNGGVFQVTPYLS